MIEFTSGYYCFRLTDFGIAKLAKSEFEEAVKSESSITGSQTMMGAIPYMSPEMIQGPKYATPASDIWSIGAILFKLMTGEYPFGVGLAAIPRIHEAKLPPKPSDFQTFSQFTSLNDKIWDVISQCLQKNMESRPSADDLSNFFGDLCYSKSPRHIGFIDSFRGGTGDWGFISEEHATSSVFFHRSSFYGKVTDIVREKRVQYAKYPGQPNFRAHPVLPLKNLS
jgi:serine/threonine-protein kinase